MNARTKQYVATILLICHLGALSHSQSPEWWVTRQARTLNASPDDYALINQGQLKQLAYAAYLEMEGKLTGGAGPQISALVQSWLAPGGVGRDDYAVANIGQLKALATLYHARLQEAGVAVPYTWTTDTSDDDDFAPANIGQAKALFAFQLSASAETWSGELLAYKNAYGGLFGEETPFVLHYLDWRCNQVQTHIGETRTLGWTETWKWQLLNGPLNWPEWAKSSTLYEALPDGMTSHQWATRFDDQIPYFIKRSILLERNHGFVAAPSLLTSIDEYEVEEVLWWPGVRLGLSLDLKQTWQVHDVETGLPVWGSLYPNVSLDDKLASHNSYQYEVTIHTYRESHSDEVTALLPEAPLGQVPSHGLTQHAAGPLTPPVHGWSPAVLTPVDAPLQALTSGTETIPFEPMRLPITGGVLATAKTVLEKRPMYHLPDGGQPQLLDRWQGVHRQGKVALAWRTDISTSLTPAVMQNWVDRFHVLIEETVNSANGSPPVTTSTSRPLADFLQAFDAGPQVIGELNTGPLAGLNNDLDREVRLSLVCSVPTLANPFASTDAGTSGTTAGGVGQSGSGAPNPTYVLHMEIPTIEASVDDLNYAVSPPYQSGTYSYSVVKRSAKEAQINLQNSQPAMLFTRATPAEIEHIPPLQGNALDGQGYYWPHKSDVDDPLVLIDDRSYPAFDSLSISVSGGVQVAYSHKTNLNGIAYAYPEEPGSEEIGTFTWNKRLEARSRLRLRAKAPLMLGGQPVNLPQGYRATFVPVVEVRNLLAADLESANVETHVLPALVMEIPPGDSASAIRNVDTLPQLSQHLPAQPNTVVRLRLLPVEVVELSPKVKDEDGNDIAGSEKPNSGKPLTPFVEEDPENNRIAHREIKVKIGDALKDKKVTWTLEELPGATPATIRGQWEDSETHEDRFEQSTAYTGYWSRRVSQTTGETTIGADGHTAIRVNVPPIGFNQVRIKIQIEGMSTPIDLIDMEVPGVVVIDPGHGGTTNLPGSNANNATANPSGILEKAMALSYGLALRDTLRQHRQTNRLNLQVFTTRHNDQNLEGSVRANLARDKGADVFVSIHFNATNKQARGSEALIRGTDQVNGSEVEDERLGRRVLDGVLAGISQFDNASSDRGVKNYAWSSTLNKNVPSSWAVLSDDSYANDDDYHPVRGTIAEIEFIDVPAVDALLNTGANAGAVKTAVVNGMKDSILNDLIQQPAP